MGRSCSGCAPGAIRGSAAAGSSLDPTFDPTEQRGFFKGVWAGLECYSDHKPVAVAHSLRRQLLEDMERCAR
jgi:hypothetical protein